MKYSILMPYYKRFLHLHNTLVSFKEFYKDRKDYEIIIMEDIKNIRNEKEHKQLLSLIEKFGIDLNIVHLETDFDPCINPCLSFNYAAKQAKGKFLVITNPECFHTKNILNGFDEEFDKNENVYIICGCFAVHFTAFVESFKEMETLSWDKTKFKEFMWYQHSQKNNRGLHFCTAISKELYFKIGGFDEQYQYGRSYDDDDFRNTIMANKIPFVLRDDLLVLHIEHHKDYERSGEEMNRLDNINSMYYKKKWNR